MLYIRQVLKLNSFDEPTDLVAKYFSRRQNRDVTLDITDVVAVYEDDNIDLDDAKGVERVVDRLVKICKSDKLGSMVFCIKAREELVKVDGDIVESVKKMRRLTHKGRVRRIMRGSRERSKVVDVLRIGIEDLDEKITDRKFLEWGRV